MIQASNRQPRTALYSTMLWYIKMRKKSEHSQIQEELFGRGVLG